MRIFCICLTVLGLAQQCAADIIFTITPTNSTVGLNEPVLFNVFLKSDVDNQEVQGIDLLVYAGSGDGLSGSFASGTNALATESWFFDTPGQAFLSFNNAPSSFNLGLANTQTQLGTLSLNTTGLGDGTYNVSIFDSLVLAPGSNVVASSGNTTSFSVSAVPEPSSLLLIGVASAGAIIHRRRRYSRTSAKRCAAA